MRRSIFSAVLCGAVAALTGCASGGGSAPTPSPAPAPAPSPAPSPTPTVSPSAYETTEYNRMGGHALIKASSVYATGADGSGQTVVVADSGIAAVHPDLAGRINATAGWDYVRNAAIDGTDAVGHGTHVAGIIAANKNDIGVHGVAFNSTLVPFKIVADDGTISVTDAMLADMAKRAAAVHAIAMNNSWGNETDVRTIGNVSTQFAKFTVEAKKAGAAGTVFVWAAMNSGDANPGMFAALPDQIKELQPYWLAVAAVDPTGKIASFSNRCGYAAAWCLSAPGVNIDSTTMDGGYGIKSGTSMATPYVTGSIALLGSYFKTLTGPQIAQRLLVTADKSGEYADQTVYGQGMLNLQAAMQPVGGAYVPTGASTTGAVSELSSVAITVPAGAAAQIKKALGDKQILVVDGFQRATFLVSAASLVRERARQGGTDWNGQSNGLSAQPISKMTAPGMSFSLFSNRSADGAFPAMSSQFAGGNTVVRMGYGTHTSWGDMSFLSAESSPHFSQFVRGGDPLSMTTEHFVGGSYLLVGQEMKLTGQFASMEAGVKYDLGVEKTFGNTKLGLMSSFQSGLPEAIAFGASKAGAAQSYQLYASHPVNDGISVVGAMGFGQSKMGTSMGEWRLDGAQSTSFASLGAILANPETNSRLGASYRMTQRSHQGMSLLLPVDTSTSGNVAYKSVSLQEGQRGRGGALGLFYEADAKFGNVLLCLTAAKETSGAWAALRRAF